MKVIFVAGPYRAKSEWEIEKNIRRAEDAAIDIWRLGAAVICPHKNTSRLGGAGPDHLWLDGALEMVRRSDALFAVPGWEISEGAKGEVALAQTLNLPVFNTILEVETWLASPE